MLSERVDVQLTLPHIGFNRAVGTFAAYRVTPGGAVISEDEWAASRDSWLPTDADRAHVLA